MERAFMVRPFKQVVEREGGEPLVLSGSIERGGFIFRIGEVPFELRTTETGQDEDGPFAKIRDAEGIAAYGGWLLSVEPEYEEPIGEIDLGPGCCIRYWKPGDAHAYDEAIRQAGHDPEKFNVIIPREEPGFSVYFDSLGNCDGYGHPEP